MHPSNIAGTDLLRVRLSPNSREMLKIDELSNACSRGASSSIITKMLKELTNEKDGIPNLHKDIFGRTALHYAAMKGRASVVKVLLDNHFDPNQGDMHGLYPLHLAIQSKQYDAAMELCKATKPNLETYKHENAVLLLSKMKYHPKMQQLLSELVRHGNSVYVEDLRCCTPLFYAVDSPLLVKQLLEFGADVHHKDDFGRNALFNSIYAGNCQVIEILIKAGSSLNQTDDFSHTPLMLAACFGDTDTAELLLEHGANVNQTEQSDSWVTTPLSLAIKHTNFEVAKIFVDHGALLDINIGHQEMIWDLLHDRKYDFQHDAKQDDESSGDAVMDDDTSLLIADYPNDNMEVEIYTMGEAARRRPKKPRLRRHLRVHFEARSSEVAREQELLQYMETVETQRKMESLLNTELVKNMNIPTDIVRLIAAPLKW